jgi:plasmid stabilization system protein ParE
VSQTKVIIEADAKQDSREARDFFADKGKHTTDDFLNELNRAFDLFSLFPEATAIAFGRTRLKPMRQFPYVIGYIFHDGNVHITGVQHGGLSWEAFERRQS